jgi:ABC-type Fe3+ transport system substrate-binding protein
MLKRGIIVLALVVIIALPFVLRPHREAPGHADDTLVLVSPHNEAIRHEFSIGFRRWYKAKTGRSVFLDWRNVGGTSDIARYLDGQYVASFENIWTNKMHKPWDAEIQAVIQKGLPKDASDLAKEARAAFMASEAGCGIDLFFGGGPFDFDQQARAGRLIDPGIRRLHPDWFTEESFPQTFGGEPFRDAEDRWFGTVLSSYGILYNKDSLNRLGFEHPPEQWADLEDPRYVGEVGLCDPTQSGSIAQAFINVIQQQMHFQVDPLGAAPTPEATHAALAKGWTNALQLLQIVGANARYFTDTSQKPPIDVADGNCAAGMCIDFYGREQQEAVKNRTPGRPERLGYASPEGGAAYSVDPIALLRGAPHPEVAKAFIEYVLSIEGQKLWNFEPGTPGGPEEFALRRLPVRRDFYTHADWRSFRSDPDENPYFQKKPLLFIDAWTSDLYSPMRFIIRVMTEDTHQELTSAWRAIIKAREPAKSRAMAVLQDVSCVDLEQTRSRVKKGLGSKNLVEQVSLARDLGNTFRGNYQKAQRIAEGKE